MKKILILCLGLFYSLSSNALSSYEANYDFYASLGIGSIKVGNADFKLEADDHRYIYTNNASVSPLWRTIYDYSRTEKSSGIVVNGQLISNNYGLTETKDDSVKKNIEINIFADQSFSMVGGVKYLKTGPGKVVDELNLYLVLSQDISKQPLQKVFTYQVADGEGIKLQSFSVMGSEIVEIDSKKLQTIKIECPELHLTLNLSEKYDYLPVLIKKSNGKSRYYLTLTSYKKIH